MADLNLLKRADEYLTGKGWKFIDLSVYQHDAIARGGDEPFMSLGLATHAQSQTLQLAVYDHTLECPRFTLDFTTGQFPRFINTVDLLTMVTILYLENEEYQMAEMLRSLRSESAASPSRTKHRGNQ